MKLGKVFFGFCILSMATQAVSRVDSFRFTTSVEEDCQEFRDQLAAYMDQRPGTETVSVDAHHSYDSCKVSAKYFAKQSLSCVGIGGGKASCYLQERAKMSGIHLGNYSACEEMLDDQVALFKKATGVKPHIFFCGKDSDLVIMGLDHRGLIGATPTYQNFAKSVRKNVVKQIEKNGDHIIAVRLGSKNYDMVSYYHHPANPRIANLSINYYDDLETCKDDLQRIDAYFEGRGPADVFTACITGYMSGGKYVYNPYVYWNEAERYGMFRDTFSSTAECEDGIKRRISLYRLEKRDVRGGVCLNDGNALFVDRKWFP